MKERMTSKPDSSSSRGLLVAAAILVSLLLPMLYVLSLGPALSLAKEGYIERATVRQVYAPIEYVCRHSNLVDDCMQAYMDWFR